MIRDWISRSNLTRASASRAAYFSRRPLDASAKISTIVAIGTLGNDKDGDDSSVMAAEFASDSEVIIAYASAGDTRKSFTPSLAASDVEGLTSIGLSSCAPSRARRSRLERASLVDRTGGRGACF